MRVQSDINALLLAYCSVQFG